MAVTSDESETTANLPLDESMTLGYITGQPMKETPRELVRQRIARALFHEYSSSVEDMEPDFRLKVDGKHKKIDIAMATRGCPKMLCSGSSSV